MSDPTKLQVLVDLRKAARLSQKEVAERFGLEPEQGRKTIGNWEAGIHPPDKSRRSRFLRYLWDDLGLRRNPPQFEEVWATLAQEWQWAPIGDAEWQSFTRIPRPTPGQRADPQAPASGVPPFKGLHYFDVDDADLFFGREALLQELIAHLEEHNFLAVVGASGSGKSSLVRAGLVPALQRGELVAGSDDWLVHTITPTANPLRSLALSLTRASESVTATATLLDDLSNDTRSLDFAIARLLGNSSTGVTAHKRLLLVIDQFEELFTLCRSREERRAFVENLLYAAGLVGRTHTNTAAPTYVVITLRADFYAHCAEFEHLRIALQNWQKFIGPMNPDELRRAIEEPARQTDWQFEPGLVNLLLDDVGDEPGALPLLSHALLETWQRREGRLLTLAGYIAAGRVQGAIAQTADTVFNRLTLAQRPIARNIFLRLTELGEGTQDTRWRVRLSELLPQATEASTVEEVLKLLVDARLVTTFAGEAEVAHEALIRAWPQLREWLADDREGLRSHRRLTEAAHEWLALDHDPGALLRGVRLEQTLVWAQAHSADLNEQEQAFLDASQAAVRQAADEKEQMQRLAQHQARIAYAGQLAARSQLASTDPHELAVNVPLLLARQAVLATWLTDLEVITLPFVSMAADTALRHAIETAPPWRLTLPRHRHVAAIWSAVFSPDGKTIATASNDQTAGIWDVASGQQLLRLLGHTSSVRTAAFSPDGKLVVTASEDGTIRLWDSATGQQTQRFEGHTGTVLTATFSPDGQTVLSAGIDQTARLWDIQTGQEVRRLQGHTGKLRAAVFSPDGQQIVTTSEDQTARLWQVNGGQEIHCLQGHSGDVKGADFSPDGRLVATAGDDKSVRLWNVTTGREIGRLEGHTDRVWTARFSPDGKTIVTASRDGTARLWDVHAATSSAILSSIPQSQEIYVLQGEIGRLLSAAFSPDGKRIVVSSNEHVVRFWDVATGKEQRDLEGHGGEVRAALFGADGQTIATAGADQRIRLWNAASGVETSVLRGHTGVVMSLALSPTGHILASAGADQTIRLWDTLTATETRCFVGHSGSIDSVEFSPDGQTLVSASADQTARLWRVQNGTEILQLVGHTAAVRAARFSPDGQMIITASADQTLRLWDVATGKETQRLTGHTENISAICFSLDGQTIATAGLDARVRLWHCNTGEEMRSFGGHAGEVTSVTFSLDGNSLLTSSSDQTARLWNVATGAEIRRFAGHTDMIWSARFSPDGQSIVTAGADRTARVWQATPSNIFPILSGHTHSVTWAAFSPDGRRIVTASQDNTVRIWEDSQLIQTLLGHKGKVNTVAFSRDSQFILSASDDGSVRLWAATTGEAIRIFTGHAGRVNSAAFHPAGETILSAGADKRVRLWNVWTGEEIFILHGHTHEVKSALFSPDSKTLVTASYDGMAHLWDVASRQPIRRLEGHTDWVNYAAFSPDGKTLITASHDGTARLWTVATGKEIQRFHHAEKIKMAAFSPDGALIVTACDDHSISLWNGATGQRIRQLAGHTDRVTAAFFSPDGRRLVTTSDDRTARIWIVAIEELLAAAAALIQREPPILPGAAQP